MVLIELLKDRPDRIECVSDIFPSSVPKVDRCTNLNGVIWFDGVDCC